MKFVNGGKQTLVDNWVENTSPHTAMREKWIGVTSFFDTKVDCEKFTNPEAAT